ncbi:MAG: LacI family transcriptional regulator [Ignavibacteria bacterium]|jgi:LacI family transcriptional regulator|nr:LacI family transcriptional regulator [Ignavibacteria bacterium]MCU7515686.1 LacI family transcriptional regulator [Ignavibacteria bacterium]
MTPTIKDVAQKAKVSIATVSLVIHNNEKISYETRMRVNKAIKDLNYHPFRSARGLASRKTGNLAFIVTEDHFLRSEPFYTHIFLGAEFEARQNEYYILLTIIRSDFKQGDRLPRCIVERNVDGIIFAGKVPQDIISCLEKYELPMAFVDYYPPAENYPVVLIDNFSGGMQAVQHLSALGHRHIAFVAGDIQHPSIRDRFQGYKVALENAGLSYSSKMSIIDEAYPARENGYSAAKRLLRDNKNVTAIFSCNDAMAIGVMQFLKESGLRVPEDVSLIGFDDVDAGLSLDPPLSTIGVPKLELGGEVMRLMADMLNNKVKSPKKVLVPVELIKRKSTAEVKIS